MRPLKSGWGSVGLGLELRVELTGKKPWMALELDKFGERAIGRGARDNEPFFPSVSRYSMLNS